MGCGEPSFCFSLEVFQDWDFHCFLIRMRQISSLGVVKGYPSVFLVLGTQKAYPYGEKATVQISLIGVEVMGWH